MKPTYFSQRAEYALNEVKEMVQTCIQCGTCTGSCPNVFAMDYTPRQLWRLVLTGQAQNIFSSQTFFLCSACYACSLRCPRGLPLTGAMGALKEIAVKERLTAYHKNASFYRSFMESIRRHGRVREMEFMTLYFSSMKNPALPLKFTPLAIKLLVKRKLPLQLPSKGSAGSLAPMFRKARQLEASP